MDKSLEELMVAGFSRIPHALFITNRAGMILARNSAAERMLCDGERISKVLKGYDERLMHWEDARRALRDGADRLEHNNVTLIGRDDRRYTVDICLTLLDEEAEILLFVLTDVSHRVTMERRGATTQTHAALAEVAARVAHELNNPLDGVLRFIGMAERDSGDRRSEYLRNAREGLLRMAEIIRDLQQQGGLRAGGVRISQVDRLLDEAVRVMNPRAQTLGVTIVSDLAEDASIHVETGMFQVFCNVIKNALDAMPDGGVLNIRARRVDQRVTLEFADTGDGIASDRSEEVFQPFYTTRPPGRGMGLGLSISREIVSRSGGTITAAPGADRGTLITVELPIPRKPQQAIRT